jgi:dTDP-4-dehydrorhamnose reductase
MKVLITGANGLLGQKLVSYCQRNNVCFLATSAGENRNPSLPEKYFKTVDITDKQSVYLAITDFQPTHIINTAAITNVDDCEINQELCYKVNVEAVRILFDLAAANHIHFQQLSTDFVFDGEKGDYSEEDEVNPLSVYAKSKVSSEKILLESDYTNWSIVRTIIVFGAGYNLSRSNIVLWAREALMKGDVLTIVDDQFRAPTWADDLAMGCMRIIEKNRKGVFHISGPTTFSIIELVQKIARFKNISMNSVVPTSSESLNQKAKRPPKTGFNLTKAKIELSYSPHSFERALELLETELVSGKYKL